MIVGLSENPLLDKELTTLETRAAETAAKVETVREKIEKAVLRVADVQLRIESERQNRTLIQQSLSD